MFYIQPTPLSKYLWLGMWSIPVMLLSIAVIMYWAKDNRVTTGVKLFGSLGLLSLVIVAGLAVSSYAHNYSNSASYNKKAKEMALEYNPNTQRRLTVQNYKGDATFEMKGNFGFDHEGRNVTVVDNKTGDKTSIYIGENDRLIVQDLKD